ncbi:hypothetical protein GE09DRAFT_1150615 [Coniochaeta sp. 2T2.1]|nr:hypothetical protein GE09DRAFT_1150615 [Coniochaeta sp. 2T2.1]
MANPWKTSQPSAADTSAASSNNRPSEDNHESETTPLLSSSAATPRYDGENDGSVRTNGADDAEEPFWPDGPSPAPSPRAEVAQVKRPESRGTRWPSIIAIALLAFLSISAILVAFFVPAAVEEYAKQAAVLEPTNLSLESLTANGVRARIQANFRLDGSRVRNDHVRRVGKATTWIVRALGTEETKVNVTLPEYDNILLGTAIVPPLDIKLVEGETTAIDFVAELTPGDTDGIRMIANEWLEGRLDTLRLKGQTDIKLKSGLIPLGTHTIAESLTFEADKIPDMPQYNITRLRFRETPLPGDDYKDGMGADVSVVAFNKYPVSVDIPKLGFEVLLPGCSLDDDNILIATAFTESLAVRPQSDVTAEVHGLIRELPESLTKTCPNSDSSPLDLLLKQYMGGEEATVFVRGAKWPLDDTPGWVADILSSVTVPIPFPGRSFDSLIRNFSLTDVHFTMPDPFANPGGDDANPKVSGNIVVLAALPSELNFDINVTGVKADADVFYKSKELGKLNLKKWQKAKSKQIDATGDQEALLQIQSKIKDAPLNVTDADVMTDVIQELLFGGKGVLLDIKARVDVQVRTVLGNLTLKGVPAEGKIPVKPLPKSSIGSLSPQVGNISITDTTASSIELTALVNITNPTPYSATVPYVGIHILTANGTLVGEATAENLAVVPGNNTNLLVRALWNPSWSGDVGVDLGRDLISGYLSGFNTSVTVRTHRGSLPNLPRLGESLSRLNLTIAAPRLQLPGGDEYERSHFIRDATFHILSSTAQFTLVSPFTRNVLYIDHVNATAFYNHTDPVGRIVYDFPIACPPGASQTPKLPVDWSIGDGGYEKLKSALGGKLKLDANATVGVRLGAWTERVWYVGRGIGANVRL